MSKRAVKQAIDRKAWVDESVGHSFPTVSIPMAKARAAEVNALLAGNNPLDEGLRIALRSRCVHFMSITVLDEAHEPRGYLVLEASVDGSEAEALRSIVDALGPKLEAIVRAAGVEWAPGRLAERLQRHLVRVGSGLWGTPGLCFAGTPGMSVKRIRAEKELARDVREILASEDSSGTSLELLQRVRARVERSDLSHLIDAKQQPGMAVLSGPRALDTAQIVWAGIQTFLWPLGVLLVVVVLAVLIDAAMAFGALAGFLIAVVALGAGLMIIGGGLFLAVRRFQGMERRDVPDDSAPDHEHLAEVMKRENIAAQNHLAGVYVLKPGLLRNLALRLTFWTIGQLVARTFRAGFLADLGTINYARWVLLPGTNTLLFFSNYGGSWESYLEDFITRAHTGLTAIWSNTEGFPRTRDLLQEGASDGDRFKRWVRRQQRPSLFWHSGYQSLTAALIRTNAAIRHGLASAATEDEALAWLSCFGSSPRASDLLETGEIPTLVFGGLKRLAHSAALLFKLPGDPAQARAWLATLAGELTFGDSPSRPAARVFGLTSRGLVGLGLGEGELAGFPAAFRQGMTTSHRSHLLGDSGDDDPTRWWWGHGEHAVDGVLLVYCRESGALVEEVARQSSRLQTHGGTMIHQVTLDPTSTTEAPREPFGFVDGISQPVIRGSQRASKPGIHRVEAGEFVLGYPDNRGHLPLSPTVPAKRDPGGRLPAARGDVRGDGLLAVARASAELPRDLGMNGTYLVIRQIEQNVGRFDAFVRGAAKQLHGRPDAPEGLDSARLEQWIAAKMVGRWRDGTSLVRFPYAPGSGWDGATPVEPDNDFLYGEEDPGGGRCPFGAHARRTNPRDSLSPGSDDALPITNRHRVLRVGRAYSAAGAGAANATRPGPGLFFMCLNADIERQFEFIQQTWVMSRNFHGLDGEVDSILGRGRTGGRLTIPTAARPIVLEGIQDFVTVRGGAYCFLPSKRAIEFLTRGIHGSLRT